MVALLSLPHELLLMVASELDAAALFGLAWSCKSLYDTLNSVMPSSRLHIHDLLEIEKWPGFAVSGPGKEPWGGDFFACCCCLHLRSGLKFSNAMMKAKRGKYCDPLKDDRKRRICIDCGIRRGQYLPGVRMQFGGFDPKGGDGFVCKSCRKFIRDGRWSDSKRERCTGCVPMSLAFDGLDGLKESDDWLDSDDLNDLDEWPAYESDL